VPVDGIFIYSKEVLTLGLLWLGFTDAIRESDRKKVFLYWKFLMLVFKREDCRNYSMEAVNLLYQTHALSSSAKMGEVYQYSWKAGVPADLHFEHLNRRLNGNIV